ncbi:hypothetical protein ACFXG4_03515 [Nocardia sp. NPDC059246]|uniref:hypothetical protein n=1 Tax=unclassified Nocardia TaxID=2637762 RepID=UPI0036A10827
MTAPNQPDPDGAINPGAFRAFQTATEADAKTASTSGVLGAFGGAQSKVGTEIREPIQAVQGSADVAVTTAQAAANTAATAEATAANAYKAASYWEAEFVSASAAVVLGVNELLIGLCQNVPTGLVRKATDIHVALLTQPNGMTFELRKWNAAGTADSLVATYPLTAGQTRANWQIVGGVEAFNRERFYVNVTSVTGSVAPVVLQILLFGVLYDPAIQTP